jgi:hypothetical protein
MQKRQVDVGTAKEAAEELSMGFSIPKPELSQQVVRARTLAERLRSSLKSGYKRIHDNILGRRLLSATVLLLAIGGMGVLFGMRTRSATAQPAAVSDLKAVDPGVAKSPKSPPEQRLVVAVLDKPFADRLQTGATGGSIESFTYVIQANDTLRDLCVSMLGRYDGNVLNKIRELNPGLKNPNLLEVGQEIRLPLSPVK